MNIPFFDLKRQYEKNKSRLDNSIGKVLNKQFFILGDELARFEKDYSEYLGVKYSIGVNSGTDGLILALKSLGIGPGDEVIMPTYTFVATALAASWIGAKPVFVDSDPDTFNISITDVESKITNKTKAIIPVHIGGAPCDMVPILDLAKKHKVKVVEDACQAHGSSYKDVKMGNFSDLSVFSFYPSKNLGAYGDAGMVCTNNEKYFNNLTMLRNYGQIKKYHHLEEGINSRLDEIQAAILREKLKDLDDGNNRRNQIAETYKRKLVSKYKFQEIISGALSNYYLLIILVEERERLIKYLANSGIGTLIHYPVPLHLQPVYKYLDHNKGDFPVAEKICNQCLSLPMYPELSDDEVGYVVDKLLSFK